MAAAVVLAVAPACKQAEAHCKRPQLFHLALILKEAHPLKLGTFITVAHIRSCGVVAPVWHPIASTRKPLVLTPLNPTHPHPTHTHTPLPQIMVRWLSRFFNYLDRYYIQRHNLHSLNDVGLLVFRGGSGSGRGGTHGRDGSWV